MIIKCCWLYQCWWSVLTTDGYYGIEKSLLSLLLGRCQEQFMVFQTRVGLISNRLICASSPICTSCLFCYRMGIPPIIVLNLLLRRVIILSLPPSTTHLTRDSVCTTLTCSLYPGSTGPSIVLVCLDDVFSTQVLNGQCIYSKMGRVLCE